MKRLPLLLVLFLAAGTSRAGDPSEDLARKLAGVKVERYAAAPGYSEGPTWRDGEVFFCSGALLRITKERKVRKYLDVNPAGTYLRGDGHILICDNKVPALLDLAPDGKVGVLVEEFEGKKLNSLNDLTVDRAGNVYWTDPNGSSREKPTGSEAAAAPRRPPRPGVTSWATFCRPSGTKDRPF
jgi:sugar lactone lactonase YvrE